MAHEQPWSSIVCLLRGSSIVPNFFLKWTCSKINQNMFYFPLLWFLSLTWFNLSGHPLLDFYGVSMGFQQGFYKNSMEFLWCFYDVLWGFYRIFIVFLWGSYWFSKVDVYGMSIGFPSDAFLYFYGISLGFPGGTQEVSLELLWGFCDISMGLPVVPIKAVAEDSE